ncbi:MAG: AraC family transcriptional regulator [Clostridia bacterium]
MPNHAKYHFDNQYHSEQMIFGPYVVCQIGDLNCDAGYAVPPHTQEVHEISYVVSGKGTFYANGKEYPAEHGTLFINSVNDLHEIVSSNDAPIRYMYMGFTVQPPVTSEIIRVLDAFFANPPSRICENAFEVQETFIRLLGEVKVGDSFSTMLMECCMHQLLCQVYRLFNVRKRSIYQLKIGEKLDSEQFACNITHYIDENIGNIANLSELSQIFGYSYTHIAKLFARQIGETLYEYYTRRRFEKARDYLAQGVSITETAHMLGYQSIHAFSRAFKEQIGTCPSDYCNYANR